MRRTASKTSLILATEEVDARRFDTEHHNHSDTCRYADHVEQ